MLSREQCLMIGAHLRARRDELGYTQENIAEKSEITLRYYQMIELGEKCASLEVLIRLCKLLSVSMDYLLFGSLPADLENPISSIYDRLTPSQRDDATKILQLYEKACRQK